MEASPLTGPPRDSICSERTPPQAPGCCFVGLAHSDVAADKGWLAALEHSARVRRSPAARPDSRGRLVCCVILRATHAPPHPLSSAPDLLTVLAPRCVQLVFDVEPLEALGRSADVTTGTLALTVRDDVPPCCSPAQAAAAAAAAAGRGGLGVGPVGSTQLWSYRLADSGASFVRL